MDSPASLDSPDGPATPPDLRKLGILVGNLGQPIYVVDANIHGVLAEAARHDGEAKVWTRMAVTSDDPLFHTIIENLSPTIATLARNAQHAVNLERASTVLLVMHPDNTGELWVDAAAISVEVMVKRSMVAGSVVFESDIADVTKMSFPMVDIGAKDRVICVFREAWRFALFFDFNPNDDLALDCVHRTLGTLYRNLKYRHIYDTMANKPVFDRLVAAGWFPFVELLGSDFKSIAVCYEADLDIDAAEARLIAKFEKERLNRLLNRWLGKRYLKPKERLLRTAVEAFRVGEPIATIKIILTEIEGVLAEAFRETYGRGAKLKELLAFAVASAEQKTGAPDTLLLPSAFAEFLSAHTFADFDPMGVSGDAGSRHAVGHGMADAATYTRTRALQALLTLDQIVFYL